MKLSSTTEKHQVFVSLVTYIFVRLMARLLKPKFGIQQAKNATGPSPAPIIGEL
jgi:hypothetical protein